MAHIDHRQDFSAIWKLEPDTGFHPNSMEGVFWPLYKKLYAAINQHNDAKSLQWHVDTLGLLRERVELLIADTEGEDAI